MIILYGMNNKLFDSEKYKCSQAVLFDYQNQTVFKSILVSFNNNFCLGSGNFRSGSWSQHPHLIQVLRSSSGSVDSACVVTEVTLTGTKKTQLYQKRKQVSSTSSKSISGPCKQRSQSVSARVVAEEVR